jgi:cytochrome c553
MELFRDHVGGLGWTAFGLLLLCAAVCDRPVDAGPPVAVLPVDPWVAETKDGDSAGAEVYAACASCHMADGVGRSDGTIPRLAGQNALVLAHKLQQIRAGYVWLPVMAPFASALAPEEITVMADYIAALPLPPAKPSSNVTAATAYATFCSACHGRSGEGNAALMAPRLCGQHAPYVFRRLGEISGNARGDADPAMAAIVSALPPTQTAEVARWLASGDCRIEVEP